jgi:hypothetical protein
MYRAAFRAHNVAIGEDVPNLLSLVIKLGRAERARQRADWSFSSLCREGGLDHPPEPRDRKKIQKAGLLQGPALSASLAVFVRDGAYGRSIPDVGHNSATATAGLVPGQGAVNRLLSG